MRHLRRRRASAIGVRFEAFKFWALKTGVSAGLLLGNSWATAFADPAAVADYRGIYVASNPLLSAARSLEDAVYEQSEQFGIYVRLIWAQLEPRPGEYDFRLLDRELSRAVQGGRRVSLSVIAGGRAPAWFGRQGVRTLAFRVGRGGGTGGGKRCIDLDMAVPWDPLYQSAYAALMNMLAEHIRSVNGAWDALRIVKLTGIGRITEELRLPADFGNSEVCGKTTAVGAWLKAGYTVDHVVASWSAMASSVAKAFPGKLLGLDTLERNDFPAIDENGQPVGESPVKGLVIKQAIAMFPGRFAVQWNGLTANGRLAETPVRAREAGAVLGWQTNAFSGFEGSGCNAERRSAVIQCDEQGYARILKRAVETGAAYLEVWPGDVLRFPDVVAATEQRLRSDLPAR